MPMVSTDTSRSHLAAVHFEANAAASTNGNAAAAFDAATGVPPMLLPEAAARAWLAVLKDVKGEVAVRVGGNGAYVALETPAGRFSSKTVDAAFPRWRDVVPPGSDWTVTLDAKAFRAACAGMPHKRLKLVPSKHELTIESEDIESACFRSATVEWTVNQGTPCAIGFNATLLQGALRTDGAITLSGTGELDPVIVRHADEPNFLGLVMPMRIA
jgi:DNA polymerase III sliding clamp (beta) subunit (PCNA family)